MKPNTIMIDGHSLTLDTFVDVARRGAPVELTESAREAIRASRELAEKIGRSKRDMQS